MMQTLLRELGHDVLSAADQFATASDEELLKAAVDAERIIVTEHKDFGELIFRRGLVHPCVIRFTEMTVAEKADAVRELIEEHHDALHDNAIIVVERHRIRIRLSGDEAGAARQRAL